MKRGAGLLARAGGLTAPSTVWVMVAAMAAMLALLLASTPARADDGLQAISLAHGGEQRRYLLHVPPGLDRSRPAPLLLALHGGGGHAEFMADDERYGLRLLAARAGYVLALPNGSSRMPRGRLATWNAGGCCGLARDRGVDDIGFLRAVVADVQGRVAIDPTRIYATGMSNGGMMAHRLACEAPDVFRAVAAVAGTEAAPNCQPSRPVSVLHIHALDDTHVRYEGGAGPDAFRDRSQVMDFVSVSETMARWARRLQCSSPPRPVLAVAGARCEAYAGCASGAQLQLCTVDGGGHSWPGAGQVRRGKPAATQALDANTTMAHFFSGLR